MRQFVLISGCSGGGKSALIAELGRLGHVTVEEPGRRVVAEELKAGGRALPWIDMAAFAHQAFEMSEADLQSVSHHSGIVFFDRGLPDAAVALQHAAGISLSQNMNKLKACADQVFMAPPWPEIYQTDSVRQHSLAEATDEFKRLEIAFRFLRYDIQMLPKASIKQRARFVIEKLSSQ
ncbi:MAG: AAA family ATPase [Sneathiella sp.]